LFHKEPGGAYYRPARRLLPNRLAHKSLLSRGQNRRCTNLRRWMTVPVFPFRLRTARLHLASQVRRFVNCLENCFSIAGSTPGTILEKFSGDPGISVMVPAAHRLKIWVQIWAQFSLLGAPSVLFTLLGITEDSSEVLCFPLAVSLLASHGGSHSFESYSAHHFKHLQDFRFGSGAIWGHFSNLLGFGKQSSTELLEILGWDCIKHGGGHTTA